MSARETDQDGRTSKDRNSLNRWLIFVATLFVAVVSLVAIAALSCSRSFAAEEGIIEHREDWPEPLAAAFPDDDSVQVYGLPRFFDRRTIVAIAGNSDAVEMLLDEYHLEPTDDQHPHASTLLTSIPEEWPRPRLSPDARWYATAKFGTEHLEGQDLFLVVTDPTSGTTLVYYDWIF